MDGTVNEQAADAFAEISDQLEAGELMYSVLHFALLLNSAVFQVEIMTAMGDATNHEGRTYNVCLISSTGQVLVQGFGDSVKDAMQRAGIRERLAEFKRTGLL